MDESTSQKEHNLFLRFLEKADLRYVLKGEITLIRMLVFGFAGLILTGAVSAVMAIAYNKL